MHDRGENRISLRLALFAIANSFRFKGRSTRSELFSFHLLSMLANLVSISSDSDPALASILAIGSVVWSYLWIWPNVALFIRRLHDQNRSAWWASVIFGLMSLAIAILYMLPEPSTGGPLGYVKLIGLQHHYIAASFTGILCSAIMLGSMLTTIVMSYLSGTPGPNRYGDDPRLTVAEPALRLQADS